MHSFWHVGCMVLNNDYHTYHHDCDVTVLYQLQPKLCSPSILRTPSLKFLLFLTCSVVANSQQVWGTPAITQPALGHFMTLGLVI